MPSDCLTNQTQKTDLEKMKMKKKALQGKFQLGMDNLFYLLILLIRGLSMAMLSVLHFYLRYFVCLEILPKGPSDQIYYNIIPQSLSPPKRVGTLCRK